MGYGASSLAMRDEGIKRLKTTTRRMLQMVCRKTFKDKIWNECIRKITEIESIQEVMRNQRLSNQENVYEY